MNRYTLALALIPGLLAAGAVVALAGWGVWQLI